MRERDWIMPPAISAIIEAQDATVNVIFIICGKQNTLLMIQMLNAI